jgi:stage II sporulation protein D
MEVTTLMQKRSYYQFQISRIPVIITAVSLFFLCVSSAIAEDLRSNSPVALHHSSIQSLTTEALSHYYSGNLSKTISIYNEILNHYPLDIDTRQNLATIYRQMGNYGLAIEHYGRLLKIEDSNMAVYKDLGWAYLYSGNPQNAMECFLQTIELEQSSESCYGIALSLCSLDKHNEALPYFEQALSIEPTSSVLHADLARALEKLGDNLGAISHLVSALKYDPSASELNEKLGDLYLEMGDYQKALESFEKALKTNSANTHAKNQKQAILSEFPELAVTPLPIKHLDITSVKLKRVSTSSSGPEIRVGLIDKANDIWLMGGSSISVTDRSSGRLLHTINAKQSVNIVQKSNELYVMDSEGTVQLKVSKPIHLILEDSSTTLLLFDINYGSGYFWAGQENRQYRGSLELIPSATSFTVVNIVTLEEYLYATVPGEMPASWPIEALKAQAVAARTYAVNRINANAKSLYHIGASIQYASYPGVSWEHPRSTQAVDETRGMILTYNGKPINAVYSSNTGGHTESSLDVWGFMSEYLVPVSEIIESNDLHFPLDPVDLTKWIKTQPLSFSSAPSYTPRNSYRWVRVIGRTDLEAILQSRYDLGTILQILPLRRGEAGSVYQVRICGTKRDVIIEGDSIRSTLGGLRSNRFIVETQVDSNNLPIRFYFYGSGWGHNVGMSQTGAAGMAEAGFTYREILKHYYPGTDLSVYKP